MTTPPPLEVLLASLESQEEDLDYYEVSTLLKECRQQYPDGASELVTARAEELAFSLAESHDARGEAHYFGPRFKGTREDGTSVCWPDVGSLTRTEIGYWATRADLTKNAFLRARYSDLVWDLSSDAAGERPPVTRAHATIDASIEAVDRQMFRWPITAQNRLRRALDVSISIRDDERAKRAVAAIMSLDDLLAQTAGRGFAFDTLTASRKVPVTDVQRNKLVADLETYLTALAKRAVIIPVEIESVVERLLRHHRQAGNDSDAHQLLRRYKEIIQVAAEKIFAPVAASALDKAHRMLSDAGLRDEAEALLPALAKANAATREQMKSFETTVTIPREQIESGLKELLDADLGTVLQRCAVDLLPNDKKIADDVVREAEKHPFLHAIKTTLHDDQGRLVANVGATDDDLDGKVVVAMATQLGMLAQIVRVVFDRLAQHFRPTPDDVLQHLENSIFDPSRTEIVRRGVAAYLSADHVAALCILIPEIEAAVRFLATTAGLPTEKRSQGGGFDLKNLGDLLADPRMKSLLTDRIALYLRVLLTDRRGWNLRNAISHGFLPPRKMNSATSDRVFHALILLGLFRRPPSGETSGGETA